MKRLLLVAVICATVPLLADGVSTNGAAVAGAGGGEFMQSAVQYAKDVIPEVRGNAAWDLIKFLLSWGFKTIPIACLLFLVAVSLFSQRLHVSLFIKGPWRNRLFKFSASDSFGQIARRPKARTYFKIKSRIDEITGKNDNSLGINSYGCVSLVMGPAEAGKKQLIYAESDAKYIISVPGEQWYDSASNSPVKIILKERTRLLVRHLFLKRPVCIVLEWEPTHELPSINRMQTILEQLVEIVPSTVSFVLAVPAYYPPQRISGARAMQRDYTVNLLNCTECRTLFDEKVKATEGLEQYKAKLEAKAKGIGIKLDRMIWVESFGRPKQVVDMLDKAKYDSIEAWISLRDWWRQVYATSSVNEEKNDWFAYLYMLALHGQMGNGSVDAEKILKNMFADDADRRRNMLDALRRICAKEKKLNLRDLDTMLIFDEPYVMERFLLSLGTMDDAAGSHVFDFATELRDAVVDKKAFDLNDLAVCGDLAAAYLSLSGLSPNLATQLSDQYCFAEKLSDMFGNCGIVGAYGRRLRDPVFMRGFVEKVISRLGALKIPHCIEMLKSINGTLLKNNSPCEYVSLAFEMLPAYAIAGFLPTAWGIDFKTVIDEFDRAGADDEIRFKCAALIFNAYMFCNRHMGTLDPGFNDLSALVKPAYLRVREYASQNKANACGRYLFEMLPVVDAGLTAPSLPSLDIANLPQSVRTAWLALLHSTLLTHYAQINSDESIRVTCEIGTILRNAELVEAVDGLVVFACDAMVPRFYELDTADGCDTMRVDIDQLRQSIGRWSECPVIARHHFHCLCREYHWVYLQRKSELIAPNAVWEMLGKLREWQNGMCDYEYSCALADFSEFLMLLSGSDSGIELRSEWKEFAELVKGFWKPILAGNSVEDPEMAANYFAMYSYLSNVASIPHDWRRSLLQDVTENWVALCGGWSSYNYDTVAKNLSVCNESILLPGVKLYWIACLYSGKIVAVANNDEDSFIVAAEEMLKEARANGTRKINEQLIGKLHEAIENRRKANA